MNTAYEPIKLTVHDYMALPDDKRVELIDGDFLLSPAPSTNHQEVLKRLFRRLDGWVRERKLGKVFFAPTDVVLSENDVVQPDLLFVAKEHLGIIGAANIQGPPDLLMEIVSPDHQDRDLVIKRNLYSKFGVREYWMVDLKSETITILTFQKNRLEVKQAYPVESTAESSLLPGFQVPTAEIFRETEA